MSEHLLVGAAAGGHGSVARLTYRLFGRRHILATGGPSLWTNGSPQPAMEAGRPRRGGGGTCRTEQMADSSRPGPEGPTPASARTGAHRPRPLDSIDQDILRLLQTDGRASIRSVAERVHVSRANAYARINRLIDDGVIRGFSARIDQERAGQGASAYITLKIVQNSWRTRARAAPRSCRAPPTSRWSAATSTYCCWCTPPTTGRCASWCSPGSSRSRRCSARAPCWSSRRPISNRRSETVPYGRSVLACAAATSLPSSSSLAAAQA